MNPDAIYKPSFVYHGATALVTDVVWQSIEGGSITADRGVKTFWRITKYDHATAALLAEPTKQPLP